MKKLETNALKKSVTLYVVISMLILMFTSITITAFIQDNGEEIREKEYSKQVTNGIEHVIKHYFNNYTYRVKRLVETSNLVELIQKKDREAAYKFLYPKFKLMQEEEPYLKVMHIHLANGKTFLRVHKKEVFDDDIASIRAMVREVHKTHKLTKGYETGKHAFAYRIFYPIFDKKSNYIGAVELGLNPNFILREVDKINGFFGMIFIDNKSLKFVPKSNNIVIDGYTLQLESTPKLKKLSNYLKQENRLEDGIKINMNGREYITHLFLLKDYKQKERVKIIFFQDKTGVGIFRNNYLITLSLFMSIVLLTLVWLVYRRIGLYQDNVIETYNLQNAKALYNQNYHQAIFDVTPNIMITTDGEEIDKANPAMHEFFGYTDTKNFKEEYDCICDFFLGADECLTKDVNGQSWLNYILENKDKLHKVCMLKGDKRHIFIVSAEALILDDSKHRSIVFFTDITEYQEMSQRFEIAVNGTNDGLWDWNLVEDKVYFSPIWKKQLGYEDNELENSVEIWKSLVHPNDLDAAIKGYTDNMSAATEVYENIHRLKHKNGSWVWILDRGKTLFDDNNKAIRMVGFHTDITKQKELEHQLKSSQHQFEQFMEFMPAKIIIKDEKLNIVYANKRVNEFFNKKSIVGMKGEDLCPIDLVQRINLFDQEIIKVGIAEEIIEFVNEKNEKMIHRNLGFRIDNGESLNIGIVSIDITEEYLAQYEIRKLKVAIDKSPVSIMMTDYHGNIEYINPNYTKISGYTLEELKGKNPRIVKSGYTSDKEYERMWKHITSGQIWTSTLKNIAKDGKEFWEDSTTIPSFNNQGKVDGYISFKVEITQTKNLEQELIAKDEMMISQSRHAAMGEMISMIAHQWRQPISVIAMDANNILADIELDMVDDNSLKEGATDIISQTQELSKTIDDFRNFFKPERIPENVFIKDIINDALNVIGKSLENNNIQVILNLKDTPKITTYSRELMQVLINIIKNAKEAFIDKEIERKTITISLSNIQSKLYIEIIDNAGGIDEEIIDKIFDPYFSTKGEKNGTGLGLYMSRTILEKHLFGTLEVKNKDNGASFELKLPITQDE